MDKVFFKGLNELRAIAAFAVVIHHIELYKSRDGYPSLFETQFYDFIMGLGQDGVYLFYVLSGFLITFLLLAEIENRGSICFRNFYMRRILKIWPLYYLLLIVSLLCLPFAASLITNKHTYYVSLIKDHYDQLPIKLLVFIFFLPNLAILLYRPIAGFAHSKSVGVEEQFYMFWPLLIQLFHKRLLWLLIGVIILRFVILSGMSYLLARYPSEWFTIVHHFFVGFKIELMAIGGFIALLRFHYWRVIQRLSLHHFFSILLCIAILASIFFKMGSFLMGIEFAILIILTINDKSNIFKSKSLDFLGKISYGIYMYHPLMMFLSFSILYKLHLFHTHPIWANVAIYILVTGLSIGLSFLSYRFLEIPFLKLKDRFTVVQSGNKIDK